MNVAHILTGVRWSGEQNQVYQIIKRMDSGNSILISSHGSILGRKVEKLDKNVYYLTLKGGFDIKYIRNVKKILISEKIDIVHVHRLQAHSNLLFLKMFSYKKFKLIVSRRVSFEQNLISQFKYNNKFIDGYIAVSEGVKRILMTNNIPEKKIKVIYSGVDIERFSPNKKSVIRQELGISKNKEIFICVGNYSSSKGQDILLEAIFHGKAKFKNCVFLFAGNKTDSDEFKKKVAVLHIEDIVFPLGFRTDIDNLLNGSNVLISPRISGEGFSEAIGEALASGKPVIATRLTGSDEMIISGRTGYLVAINDVNSLLYGILNLYNKPVLQKELGENGRKLIAEKFSIDKTVKETFDYYKRIRDT